MEFFQKIKSNSDNKKSRKAGKVSAYHHYVLATILPDAEREYLAIQKTNKGLMKENEILKRKVESFKSDAEKFKAEWHKLVTINKDKDNQMTKLMHCKSEASVLGKRFGTQERILKRVNKENEALKDELEATKIELKLVKQSAVSQRAEQQNLKEQLDQVKKDRDGLNDKWQRFENECSQLRDKITNQQLILNSKNHQSKQQMTHIQVLKEKNQQLEKEMACKENDAEYQRRELQKCEKDLNREKEKLRESKIYQAVGDKMDRKIVVVQQSKPRPPPPPSQQVPFHKMESLTKDLLAQTEELTKTKKLCEELKERLTQVAEQLILCQVTVRDQKDKLKAVTAERNIYKSDSEKLGIELADIKKDQRCEELQKKTAMRRNKV